MEGWDYEDFYITLFQHFVKFSSSHSTIHREEKQTKDCMCIQPWCTQRLYYADTQIIHTFPYRYNG